MRWLRLDIAEDPVVVCASPIQSGREIWLDDAAATIPPGTGAHARIDGGTVQHRSTGRANARRLTTASHVPRLRRHVDLMRRAVSACRS